MMLSFRILIVSFCPNAKQSLCFLISFCPVCFLNDLSCLKLLELDALLNTRIRLRRVVKHLPLFSLPGFGRLPGKDLGNRRRASAGDPARPRRRDFRHGRQLREHHDRRRLLRQDHQSVVLTNLCPLGRPGGTRSLHHLTAGVLLKLLTLKPYTHFSYYISGKIWWTHKKKHSCSITKLFPASYN